ncbi:MAG: acylphosphatase, partial [Gammaproteobacteria bacterium]|nr:acylphosphatase [Gammaproteobacteria bacterium]
MLARKLLVTGQVQGVGFRPFIFNLAEKLELTGWVQNTTGQVEILIQGNEKNLNEFEATLTRQHPPLAKPHIEYTSQCRPENLDNFSILNSAAHNTADIHIPPDFFTCDDCLNELTEKHDRRYRYPFINCTQCGPRYTLIEKLPYDRPNTSMKT